MPVATVGRVVSVRCSPRLPLSAAWCAGHALADGQGVWLLDVAPQVTTRDPDYALMGPGEHPTWAMRVDHLHGLVNVTRTAEGLADWPSTWPMPWVQACVLADGRQAGILSVAAISQALCGAAT